MPNYVFAYHGGKAPETPEEGAQAMAMWQAWFGDLGAAIVDAGAPVGQSKTVSSSGIANDGGSNPLSGYTIVKADNIEAACKMAGGCPVISDGGSVEVAEAMEM